ncbi:MAG: prepilin-type N-terminal cleavage/methylation domain-containing protein [Calothrix sp. C42_A2020_038]|nr:prepilin-type N-terminal cleavage/methylation domain-containing protein [Calothrix sp. C42_A2020_038]
MVKRQYLQKTLSSNESGFTIIESLIAIIIAAILLAATAPVIVLSTATRVQARRVELATQAAKTFVDAVQSQTISLSGITAINLPAATKTQPRNLSNVTKQADYLVNTTNMPVPSNKNSLYCYHNDGKLKTPTDSDCDAANNQFFIQAAKIKVQDSNPNEGYRLAIRVYRKDAFEGSEPLLASTRTQNTKQRTFTGGLGQKKAPLVETTIDISTKNTTFESLCRRLGRKEDKDCSS